MILCNGGFRLALAFYAQGFLERMHLRHQTQRVNPNPALHYLKMQVETCAVAGAAYIYGLHRTKLLSFMTRPSKI